MKQTPLKKIGKVTKRRQIGLRQLAPPLDGLCEKCHHQPDWRGLHRHHKAKRSQGGDESPENIIWLCGVCHSKEHGIVEVTNGQL